MKPNFIFWAALLAGFASGSAVAATYQIKQPAPGMTAPPSSCALPWGGTAISGQSVTAYATTSVSYGSNCSSETRTCTNGTLTGSYAFTSCTPDAPGVALVSGVRRWADGTAASSCAAYLTPATGYTYTGDTGNGVYAITASGSTTQTYCDMAGGGWTLVARVLGTSSAHITSAPVGTLTGPAVGGVAKLSDTQINALLSGRTMRVSNDAGVVYGYFKGTFSGSGSTNMSASNTETGTYTGTCAWTDHAGFNTYCGGWTSALTVGLAWGHRTNPATYHGIAVSTAGWNQNGNVWVR